MQKKPNPTLIVAQCITLCIAFLLFATYMAVTTQNGGAVPTSTIATVGAVGVGLMFWMQSRRIALGFRNVIIPAGQHPWDHAFDFLKKSKKG